MKTLLIFVLGLLAGLILTYGLCTTGNLPFSCDSEGNLIDSTGNVVVIDTIPQQEVIVDPAQANQMITEFGTKYPNSDNLLGIYGGKIYLEDLRCVLAQVPVTQNYINYRFGFSNDRISGGTSNGVIYLLLSAGNFNPNKYIIKNGNNAESFCPYTCD